MRSTSTRRLREPVGRLGAVGHVFAAHAGVAWDHARQVEGLTSAVASRTLIGQAQGILMSTREVTADDAFDLLRSASQRSNRRLREVAQDVVDTGDLAPLQRRAGSPRRRDPVAAR